MVRKKIAYVEELEARLVRDIRFGRATSRLELATKHKLAPSTVGIYIDRLLASGHLREENILKSLHPGRPAQTLHLHGEAGVFVGVEFWAQNIHAVCVDFAGTVLSRHDASLSDNNDAEAVLRGLEDAIEKVVGNRFKKLLGIGVGVPGLVDAENGIALHYRYISGWENIAISNRLHQRFRVPILLENNARATAMGVMLFEPGLRYDHFACLLVRSGVGAGIMVNGKLHRGFNSLAGEVGRIQPSIENGHGSTLEEIASAQAILDFVRDEITSGKSSLLSSKLNRLSIADVIDAAREGDELARVAIQRVVKALGWLIHLLALISNPQAVFFSGPLNELGDWFRLEVQASLNQYAELSRTERPVILLSVLGREAGALGAASLAIDAWKPIRT